LEGELSTGAEAKKERVVLAGGRGRIAAGGEKGNHHGRNMF